MKNLFLVVVFGTIYFVIESIFKGHLTHWSMAVVGGISGFLIGKMNENISWDLPFWRQCFYGGVLITICEGLSGLLLNKILGLNIWHYTFMTFFFGQCSIPFSLAWILLSGVAIVLDDWFRWKFFGEEKPVYDFSLR